MDDLLKHVPEKLRQTFRTTVALTDAFCDARLDAEYGRLCREMAAAFCQEGSPVRQGKPAGWAAGIVHAVGWVNFLDDPKTTPHATSDELARGLGISKATMMAKSRVIREGLDLVRMDPDWCTSAMLADNPLVWTVEVNGFLIDMRCAPRDLQEIAYEQGLIPSIPPPKARREPDKPAEPSQRPCKKPSAKPPYDGPTLFDGLDE